MLGRHALAVAVHVVLFLGSAVGSYLMSSWWTTRQRETPAPTCMRRGKATRNIVYLHGLDSHAPSWQELQNRRELAAIPDAVVAIPRAPSCGSGRCWSAADDARQETVAAIRAAAEACFDAHASYGVVGFSRGGFALAGLPTCADAGATWALVAGAYGSASDLRLRECPVAVVIGRRDRFHHEGAVQYALMRRAAGMSSLLLEFDGGHRLDAQSLVSALRAIELEVSGRVPPTGLYDR